MSAALRVVSTIDPLIGNMDRLFLECRGYGHMFRPLRASWDGSRRATVETLLCRGCGTERDQFIDRDGYRSRHSVYRYPEGYVVKGEALTDRASRAAIRVALLAS